MTPEDHQRLLAHLRKLGLLRDPVVERRDRWEDGSTSFPYVPPESNIPAFYASLRPFLTRLIAEVGKGPNRDFRLPPNAGIDRLIPPARRAIKR